jgi:hypothetical protein
MFGDLSTSDLAERDAIIAGVQSAFAGVTRGERGISWNECVAIDNYESDAECEAARRSDGDSHWNEIVDDPDWHPFPGIGGFSFINAEGFRYYLPPTMIRFLRGDNEEWFPGDLLESIERFTEQHVLPLWSEEQLHAVARFIDFMARHHEDQFRINPDEPNAWAEALKRRWGTHLTRLP